MKKIKEIGIGNPCKKCKENTVIRAKQGKIKPQNYFSQWEFCKNCVAVYFDKKFKINAIAFRNNTKL